MILRFETELKAKGIRTDTYLYTFQERFQSGEVTNYLIKINGGNCDG